LQGVQGVFGKELPNQYQKGRPRNSLSAVLQFVFHHLHTPVHVLQIQTDDGNCSTWAREDKAKKGGRPKKSKPEGRKHVKKKVLKEKVITLRNTSAAMQHPQFSENLELVRKKKGKFFCPVCKDGWCTFLSNV